jgi:hypothetical protein
MAHPANGTAKRRQVCEQVWSGVLRPVCEVANAGMLLEWLPQMLMP